MMWPHSIKRLEKEATEAAGYPVTFSLSHVVSKSRFRTVMIENSHWDEDEAD